MSKVVTQAFVLSSPQAWMFFTKRDQRLKLKLHKDLLFKCNFKMKVFGSYMSVLYNFWQLLQPRLSWNIPAGSPISISHQKNASRQISKQNILWNFFAIHTHTQIIEKAGRASAKLEGFLPSAWKAKEYFVSSSFFFFFFWGLFTFWSYFYLNYSSILLLITLRNIQTFQELKNHNFRFFGEKISQF